MLLLRRGVLCYNKNKKKRNGMLSVVCNTSNPGKQKELQRFFAMHGYQVAFTNHDLPEIQADGVDVVVHKACQVPEGVLVEDVSLDILREKVGVDVRWLIGQMAEFVGKKACWQVLLAQQKNGKVYVYAGKIHGLIVQKRENSTFGPFGFDPYFMPDGCNTTLAEQKSDAFSARAQAVERFAYGQTHAICQPINDCRGLWQNQDG